MIEAVIFDMDGLLIDSEPLWKEAEIKVFQTVGIDLTEQGCEETVGLRIDEVVELWYDRHPWNNKTKENVVQEIIECMQHLILTKGVAKPGVNEVINFFKKIDIPMAIATSSYKILLDTVVDKLDINSAIQIKHSAEYERYGKPHPEVFITTSKLLEKSPQNCLVFEDSLNGVIAAKAARMKVIAVPENTHTFNKKLILADQIINTLQDFNSELFNNMNNL